MTAAGAITFSDGLRLTRLRGELMKRAGVDQPGAMAAVLGLDIDAVRETVTRATEQTGRPVVTANDNCRGQVVISGEYTALEQAMVLLRDAGARRVVKLAVSIAAHSPLMQPAADRFHEALAETTFATPQVPVYANRSAAPVTSPEDVLSGLSAQLTGPVRWRESISAMIADGAQTFIEIGPGDVLTGLLRRIDRSKRGYAVNSVQALRNLRAI
jgi:[acyl-carrier-protein] S-malonyltransferase